MKLKNYNLPTINYKLRPHTANVVFVRSENWISRLNRVHYKKWSNDKSQHRNPFLHLKITTLELAPRWLSHSIF